MRGPPPATRSGTACASAFITASCIAPDGATTELDVAAGCSARQIVPGRAITEMRSIEPWLCGHLGARHAHERHSAGRGGGRVGPVDAALRLRPGLAPVDRDPVAGDLHPAVHAGVEAARAVGVDPALAGVLAVGDRLDLLGHPPVRVVDQRVDVAKQLVGPVLQAHVPQLVGALAHRAHLRQQVAVQRLAVTDVRQVEPDHVLPPPPALDELDGRQRDALLIDVARRAEHARRRGGAGVLLVAAGDRPEHVPLLEEHRHGDHEVADVRVAAVGIVAGEDVALGDVAREVGGDLAQHEVHRRRVDRDARRTCRSAAARRRRSRTRSRGRGRAPSSTPSVRRPVTSAPRSRRTGSAER